MRKTAGFATTAVSLAALFAGVSLMPTVAAAADDATIKLGKEVAVDRKKGNCLACHMMGDGVSPGNIVPPLIAMQALETRCRIIFETPCYTAIPKFFTGRRAPPR